MLQLTIGCPANLMKAVPTLLLMRGAAHRLQGDTCMQPELQPDGYES